VIPRGAAMCVALGCAAAAMGDAGRQQSALNPAATQAEYVSRLWWIFVAICSAVYVLVIVFLAVALARRRSGMQKAPKDSTNGPIALEPGREKRVLVVVSGAVAATVVILFALLIGELYTSRAVAAVPGENPQVIQITGHQWWWEVRYDDPVPSNIVTSANEIHVPVGRPVRFDLRSADVIHSFWAPNFAGKRDLIPGRPTSLWVRADRAGEFRGQCAEFCGHQHAHMRFVIIAQPANEFDEWLTAQRISPPGPATDAEKRGQQVFLGTTCGLCHTIQGTPARATVGPDLTHLAGRKKIAAATLDNTRGNLAGWIIDPQRIKPGVRMPQHALSPDQLNDLLDYLATLK
jgi:cytochrome c oxidase subunit II